MRYLFAIAIGVLTVILLNCAEEVELTCTEMCAPRKVKIEAEAPKDVRVCLCQNNVLPLVNYAESLSEDTCISTCGEAGVKGYARVTAICWCE